MLKMKADVENSIRFADTRTKQVNKVILCGNVLKNIIHAELYKELRLEIYCKYQEMEQKGWIKFSFGNETGYWNSRTQTAIPVQSNYNGMKSKCFDRNAKDPDKNIVTILFDENCPQEIVNGIRNSKTYNSKHYIGCSKGSYGYENKEFVGWNDNDSIHVTSVDISASDFIDAVISKKYTVLSNDTFKEVFMLINNKSIFEIAEKSECISKRDVDKLIKILGIDKAKTKKEVTDRVMSGFTITPDMVSDFTNELLSCDKIRADLEVYEKKRLDDVNEGHWELWSNGEPIAGEGQVVATLEKPLVARNPVIDIHEDGLIGIDFGTKSTIVSKRDGREKTTLLRVGTGQLNKKAVSSHYENPTIMEFINLEKFIADYKTKSGRPQTSIDDLRVSHSADNDLKNCTVSDVFYSFFYDIKQWCGDTERNIKIIDQKGMERVLPAFVTIGDDDFNPLELYAYYLGLYINNMHNKEIYLDYVLSFPVTYEKTVKEKILASFTRGLKKSLPETVLENEEIMSKFRVRQGVSEPAAYAITALQGYGFEPEEDENVLYAIFDFGGGTTDFDFGLWRSADDSKRDERRYDYVIEHFGSEGDKYLGGENLLELLAFEVFKANADLLGKKKGKKKNKNDSGEEKSDKENANEESAGFSFSKPKECDAFPGSETLISDSQEARRNTKQLMEALRPFWEGIIGVADNQNSTEETENENNQETTGTKSYNGYIFRNDEKCKFPIKDGAIEVNLFDRDGNPKSKCKLYIENPDEKIDVKLVEILEKRIERGISNFFTSIYKAFRNETAVKSKVNEIQIFLAGNSSKSPILRRLFDEYIKEIDRSNGYYHLFPPLGTEEAFEIQQELGIKVDKNDITAPTGKTGVAYGLIAGREGGKIKVISETKADAQTKFRYNIGVAKRGKFKMILDRTLVDYGQWVCLTDAGIEDFEIYYICRL